MYVKKSRRSVGWRRGQADLWSRSRWEADLVVPIPPHRYYNCLLTCFPTLNPLHPLLPPPHPHYSPYPTPQVLGTVRNIFTIFAGAFLYGETVTLNEWLGYSVALAGFAAYNAAKAGYWDKAPAADQPAAAPVRGAEGAGYAYQLSATGSYASMLKV